MLSQGTSFLVLSSLPFFAALLLGFLSPLVKWFGENRVRRLAKNRFDEETTENFVDYARQAYGLSEMISALIITSISGGVTLLLNQQVPFYIIGILTLSALIFMLFFYKGDPHKYNIRGPWTPDEIFVIVINILFIAAIYLSENPGVITSVVGEG